MLRPLKLFGLFARISVLNEVQYRANFFMQVLQSGLSLGTGLIVLNVVYSYTDTLGGWSQAELLAIYGVFVLMGGLIGSLVIPNMWAFMEDVREGRLDFTLTKPEDSQVLISVRVVAIWRLVDVVLGIAVLSVAIARMGLEASWWLAFAFASTLVMGMILLYCVLLLASILSFWFVRVWELMEMMQSIFQAGRWPVGIYPDWLRLGLTYLIPVAFAVTVPAEALTGRLTPQLLAGTFVFTLVALFITRRLWMLGLRNYSGASA
ncbi:MAG: ABC-2 family transporter protein [Anaerolineales bacterium]|nr:ABC-2 family transporter protein [Anaerolineales bacterium]